MTPPTSTPVDPATSTSDNGDGRANNNRGLMVREYESHALSPYMGMGTGGMYVDGTPAGMSFAQLLHALRRRWLLALIVGVLLAVPLAALVWLVTPDHYEVQAWLRVGDTPGRNRETRVQTEYDAYRKTQATRIKSPLVLLDALNKPGIGDLPMLRAEREPQRFLEDELSVAVPIEQELLIIKMRGRDPQQLVKIVNAVRDSYLSQVVDIENRQTGERMVTIENAKNAVERDISNKRAQLLQLQKDTNSINLAQVKAKYDMLLMRNQSLLLGVSNAKDQYGKVLTELEIAENQDDSAPPEYVVEMYLSRDDRIAGLGDKIGRRQEYIDHQIGNSRQKDRDPMVVKLREEIKGLQSKLENLRVELRPLIEKHIRTEMRKQSGQDLGDPKELAVRKRTLEATLGKLEAEQKQVQEEVSSLGRANSQLEEFESQIKELERTRANYAEQLADIQLALKAPPRVTALDKAQVPEGSNPLFRLVMTIFAGIVGFLVGSGGVVAMEYQAHRLNTGGELSTHTGLRVLGTVPNLEALSRAKGLNGAAVLQGILAESVDSIRTILLQQTRADAPRVILVTSAGDREGKTTVAAHLAASLARSGRRTLLVDGDIRSPSIHAMFSAALEPGLCEMLRGEVDLEGVIQPTQVDGLMLIAAGQCDYQAIAALAKQSLKDVLQKAREQFEFVVFDAAPVLTYADTLLMGAQVDAAVLSVRRDVSQLPKVYEARERLESVGIRVLGAVVNGITETSRRPAYALPSPA